MFVSTLRSPAGICKNLLKWCPLSEGSWHSSFIHFQLLFLQSLHIAMLWDCLVLFLWDSLGSLSSAQNVMRILYFALLHRPWCGWRLWDPFPSERLHQLWYLCICICTYVIVIVSTLLLPSWGRSWSSRASWVLVLVSPPYVCCNGWTVRLWRPLCLWIGFPPLPRFLNFQDWSSPWSVWFVAKVFFLN